MKGALDDCTEFGQQSRSAQAAWQPRNFTIALPVAAPPTKYAYTTRKTNHATLPNTYWEIIHETLYVHYADNAQASDTVQHTYLGGSHRADNDRMAANANLEASLTAQEPWLLTSLKLHSLSLIHI